MGWMDESAMNKNKKLLKRRAKHRSALLRSRKAKAHHESLLRDVLRDLGLWDRIRRTELKEFLFSQKYPGVRILLPEAETNDRTTQIRQEMRAVLDKPTFDCPV